MAKQHILTSDFALTAEHFHSDFWQQKNALTGTSGGRHTVWFIASDRVFQAAQNQWVLRHYYRGGLPGRFIRRSFVYTGIENTRSVAEFRMLTAMAKQGLPVPRAIGAFVNRQGLRYQASLLIERIEGSEDLGRLLLKQPLTSRQWQTVGATIKRFHVAGVFHSDLNCKNILWHKDNQTAHVIDFDHCHFKAQGNSKWQQANLERLYRSFQKEQQKTPAMQWQEKDWQALLTGYLD